jgi:hypothetical protein
MFYLSQAKQRAFSNSLSPHPPFDPLISDLLHLLMNQSSSSSSLSSSLSWQTSQHESARMEMCKYIVHVITQGKSLGDVENKKMMEIATAIETKLYNSARSYNE